MSLVSPVADLNAPGSLNWLIAGSGRPSILGADRGGCQACGAKWWRKAFASMWQRNSDNYALANGEVNGPPLRSAMMSVFEIATFDKEYLPDAQRVFPEAEVVIDATSGFP